MSDEGVTFLIDHPEKLQECPYALLRKRVRLHQYYLPGKGVGEPLSSPAGVDEEDLAGIALVGEQLAIRGRLISSGDVEICTRNVRSCQTCGHGTAQRDGSQHFCMFFDTLISVTIC